MPKYYLVAIEVPEDVSSGRTLDAIKKLGADTQQFNVLNGFRIHEDGHADFRIFPDDIFAREALALRIWRKLEEQGKTFNGITEKGYGFNTVYKMAAAQLNQDTDIWEHTDRCVDAAIKAYEEAKKDE